MADQPTPSRNGPTSLFWAFVGLGVLGIAGALTYKIVTTTGPITVTGSKDGQISISLLQKAQVELKAAADGVATAQATLDVREKAVSAASDALSAKEAKLNEVADKLKLQSPAADPAAPHVVNDLAILRQQNPTAALTVIPKLDPRVLRDVDSHLSEVKSLSNQLATK